MSANVSSQFQLVNEKGWKRGLGNLLQGEYSAWFKSSRWWKHLLVWFAVINGMMGIMVYVSADAAKGGSEGPPLLYMYGIFGGLLVAFGVMVIMQRVLVREKQEGTAAWVLSKPVTRTAFVVSRLVVNLIAILITSVIVPGAPFPPRDGWNTRSGTTALTSSVTSTAILITARRSTCTPRSTSYSASLTILWPRSRPPIPTAKKKFKKRIKRKKPSPAVEGLG